MTIKYIIECDCCGKAVTEARELSLEGFTRRVFVGSSATTKDEHLKPPGHHFCAVCWKGKIRPALELLKLLPEPTTEPRPVTPDAPGYEVRV